MTYRNRLLGTGICYLPPDLPVGGNNNQNNGQDGNKNNNNNDNNNNNNNSSGGGNKQNENPLDAFGTMWQPKPPAGGSGNNNNAQPNGNNNNNNNTNPNNSDGGANKKSPFAEYTASLNHFEKVSTDDLKAAFEANDYGKFLGTLNSALQGFHDRLLKEMDKFGQHYQKESVKEAVSQSAAGMQTTQFYDNFFADPENKHLNHDAVRPLVKGILNQMMKKEGATAASAYADTKKYLQAFGTSVHKSAPNGGNRSGNDSNDMVNGVITTGKELDFSTLFQHD